MQSCAVCVCAEFYEMQIYFINSKCLWSAGKIKKCLNFMENKTITIPPMLRCIVSNL